MLGVLALSECRARASAVDAGRVMIDAGAMERRAVVVDASAPAITNGPFPSVQALCRTYSSGMRARISS